MKLHDLHQAYLLHEQRRELLEQVKLTHSSLGVTIQGRYQGEEIVDAARPAVVAVLQQRVQAIEEKLVALGVDMEPPL